MYCVGVDNCFAVPLVYKVASSSTYLIHSPCLMKQALPNSIFRKSMLLSRPVGQTNVLILALAALLSECSPNLARRYNTGPRP
jgi:hypothetical protein